MVAVPSPLLEAMPVTERICVHVRERPLGVDEQARGSAWRAEGNTLQQQSGSSEPYQVDSVFDSSQSTAQVFSTTTRHLVGHLLDGFNSTVFAYGQTGSGKTHTMRGCLTLNEGADAEPGIVPLAVAEVFKLKEQQADREFLMRVSFMELYNEEIIDLLAEPGSQLRLRIVKSKERGVLVPGLTEKIVTTPQQVLELLRMGDCMRHVGETLMNKDSSRSHAIFRLAVESRCRKDADSAPVRVSTLTLVDLAGSERVGKTGAEGARMKEGASINKSLLTLGTVIDKLSEGQHLHIPYRDSKLTRILKPSLGGNAKTAIICTVNAAANHLDETENTLRFACRAKRVVNTAVANEVLTDAALIQRQAKEIAELKRKLQSDGNPDIEEEISRLRAELLRREEEQERLQAELDAALEEQRCADVARQHAEQEQQRAQCKVENLTGLLLAASSGSTGSQARRERRQTYCPAAGGARAPLVSITNASRDGSQRNSYAEEVEGPMQAQPADDIYQHSVVKALLDQQRQLRMSAEEQAVSLAALQEQAACHAAVQEHTAQAVAEAAAHTQAQQQQCSKYTQRAEAAEERAQAAEERAALAEAEAAAQVQAQQQQEQQGSEYRQKAEAAEEQLRLARQHLENVQQKAAAAAAARTTLMAELTQRAEVAEELAAARSNEIAEVQQQAQAAVALAAAREEKLSQLEAEALQFEQRAASAEALADERGRETASLQQRVAALEAAASAAQQEAEARSQELSELRRRAEAAEAESAAARQEVAVARIGEISQLTAELQAAASGRQSAEDQLAKARALLESAQQMSAAAAAARASQVAELTKRVEATEAALAAAKQEGEAAAGEAAAQRAEVDRLQGMVGEMTSTISSLHAQLDQGAQLAAQELGKARQRVEAAEAACQAAEQAAANSAAQAAELTCKLKTAEQAAADAAVRAGELTHRVEAAEQAATSSAAQAAEALRRVEAAEGAQQAAEQESSRLGTMVAELQQRLRASGEVRRKAEEEVSFSDWRDQQLLSQSRSDSAMFHGFAEADLFLSVDPGEIDLSGDDSCDELVESTAKLSQLESLQQRGHQQEQEAEVGPREAEGAAEKQPLGSGAAALQKLARELASKRKASERVSEVGEGNYKAADGRWNDARRCRRGAGLLKQ